MHTDEFFKQLPVLQTFDEVCKLNNYQKIPDDWYVIVADVVNSTEAIQSGKYKAVNFVGVSVIAGILNIAKNEELPYMFGGDGASLCIPPNLLDRSKLVLANTRNICLHQFSLSLRTGIIPVKLILEDGHNLLIAKHKISEFCTQASFMGGGMEYADTLLKHNDQRIEDIPSIKGEYYDADYEGLECRWDCIPSPHGETISLIVKATHQEVNNQNHFYSEVLSQIKDIYGEDNTCRPLTATGLSLTMKSSNLKLEAGLKTDKKSNIDYLFFLNKIRLQSIIGWFLMKIKLNLSGIKWGDYKADLIKNTDFKKFDGILRMVISGDSKQRIKLENYLESNYKQKNCVYGIHYSDSAYITCLINNRAGNHFHFIDCADGGYAIAALQLKSKLKESR